MDSKVIIAIVAAVVVLGAVGGGAAFFLMNKDDDKHNSDFTLMDSISTDGIKGGLYYICDSSEKGMSTTSETVTAEGVTSDNIRCQQTIDTKYDEYKEYFDVDQFKAYYFDFTDSTAVPSGVTCEKTGPSLFGFYTYTINGTGTKTYTTGEATMTFTNVKLVVADDEAEAASGSATVKGDYEINLLTNINKYKIDLQQTFSGSEFEVYSTTSGDYHADLDLYFTSIDQYKAAVFMPLNGMGITPTKEDHRGVQADKYDIKGTFYGHSYDTVAYGYKGYLMDGSGTVDGEKVSANVQIYYV